jgi:hypothetical protein
MNLETVSADDFGASLRGIGLNLVVRDVLAHVQLLGQVFGMGSHQATADFAILTYGSEILQLHSDGTYHANPLGAVVRAVDARGPGVEIRLYDTDPETAVATAETLGLEILQPPTDKPHGLREAYIICPDGYVWVPSRPLS